MNRVTTPEDLATFLLSKPLPWKEIKERVATGSERMEELVSSLIQIIMSEGFSKELSAHSSKSVHIGDPAQLARQVAEIILSNHDLRHTPRRRSL